MAVGFRIVVVVELWKVVARVVVVEPSMVVALELSAVAR